MGRSVSVPQGAAVVVYAAAPTCYWCRTCNEQADDHDECATCKAAKAKPDIHPDYDLTNDQWQEDISTLADDLRAAFPSLLECDEWLGRGNSEDHAFLRNNHAHVTVSEYCGLAAVCLVPRAPEYCDVSPLAENWCSTVEARFRKVVAGVLGDTYNKVATASNGEAFFEKRAAA